MCVCVCELDWWSHWEHPADSQCVKFSWKLPHLSAKKGFSRLDVFVHASGLQGVWEHHYACGVLTSSPLCRVHHFGDMTPH